MALELPQIGLGTAAVAGLYKEVARDTALQTLETAWDLGIRYFDTAPHYGQGKAERLLGDFLRDKPDEEIITSTKVGRLLSPSAVRHAALNGFVNPLPFDQNYDYSYDGIMRSYEDSLQRLGLNRIDILYVHDIGERTHGRRNDIYMAQLLNGGFRALAELKASGAVQAIGIGVNEVEICETILAQVEIDLILLAGRYTLLDRSAEARLLEMCDRSGTRFVIGGVFNSGILATGAVEGAHWDYGPAPEEVLVKVSALEVLCKAFDITLPEAALAFPIRRKQVASLLLGNGHPSRLKSNVTAIKNAQVPPAFWDLANRLITGKTCTTK